MDDLVSKLKQDTQCSLCNETLIEPKILSCFHTFCKLCIKRHAELIEEANIFKCPECKTETSLPELSSVEDLKPSLLHSRMVKILEFVQSEKVCSVSGSHSPASWHCFDCDRSLCDECEKSHSVFTTDHHITCLSDLNKEDLELMLKRENYCRSHKTKIYEFYCKDCNKCICVDCLKNKKCGVHNTIDLEDYTPLKRSLLQKIFYRLKDKQDKMQIQVAALKDITNTAKGNGQRAKQEVHETVKQLIAAIHENEQVMVAGIEQRIEKAQENQLKGQLVLDQTQSVLDYLSKMIENGLASEIEKVAKEVEGFDKSIDRANTQDSRFKFVCSKEANTLKNSDIGTLKPMLTDHTMSMIKLDNDRLETSEKARLVLMTKTSTGELNDDPYDAIVVKMTPKENVKIEEKFKRTGGKIEVEFMPIVSGPLTAEVQVNGNHVSNSPLIMDVKPQHMTITEEFEMKDVNTASSDFTGIAVNKENSRIAVADKSSHCVHVFNTDGDLLLTYGSKGGSQGQLNAPNGLAFVNETDLVISDFENHRICIVNTMTGTTVKTFGKRGLGNGEFKYPRGVHVDDDGNIFVSDYHNHRVQVFTRDGDYQYQFGSTIPGPFDPVSTVTHGGRFYVAHDNKCGINIFKTVEIEEGITRISRISTIGERGSGDGQLNKPWGLTIDNDHHLMVCDRGNNRIQKFTLDGHFVCKMDIPTPSYIAVLKGGDLMVTAGRKVFFLRDRICMIVTDFLASVG